MRVLLGPSHELHGGIHGALTDRPADSVEYVERSYTHFFQHAVRSGRPFSPVHEHSECEWVRFTDERGVDVIHSARFPVETVLPWVVDADCLFLPLQIGAFFALGLHHGAARPTEQAIRNREALMLARYAEPRCRRIILRTAFARRQLLQRLVDRGFDAATIDAVIGKTEVVYPAVATASLAAAPPRPSILFMGRTFVDKGGRLAMAVFERLRERCGASFDATIVADCPPDVVRACAALNVDVQPTGDRARYVACLARADIFFSPTLFESFGMGLVEAAAAGMAIVSSSGPGMEHIGELFEDGREAVFVSNGLDEDARVRRYAEVLAALIDDESRRRRLAAGARALAASGRLSLSRHNQVMGRIYTEAGASSTPGCHPAVSPADAPSRVDSPVLGWSEQTCHWTRRRWTPIGGVRICV